MCCCLASMGCVTWIRVGCKFETVLSLSHAHRNVLASHHHPVGLLDEVLWLAEEGVRRFKGRLGMRQHRSASWSLNIDQNWQFGPGNSVPTPYGWLFRPVKHTVTVSYPSDPRLRLPFPVDRGLPIDSLDHNNGQEYTKTNGNATLLSCLPPISPAHLA